MNTKLQELKSVIKSQARIIRETRQKVKETQRTGKYAGLSQSLLVNLKRDNRHHLIAYGELRGRTREQIEKPRPDNLPIESEIERIKEKYTVDETVCDHAA